MHIQNYTTVYKSILGASSLHETAMVKLQENVH